MSLGSSPSATIVPLGEITTLKGRHLGWSSWHEVTQAQVDGFARDTGDDYWIHTDPKRAAAEGPFGGTIAHGYLTLSCVVPMMHELLQVQEVATAVNYGLDRVRFPAPVPVGSRIRAGLEVVSVDDVKGGKQGKLAATIEIEGSERPACVAEILVRWYA